MVRPLTSFIGILVLLAATGFSADFSTQPFSGKLIYSETPEIGKKWHGGIRDMDILCLEGYLNINGWLTLDVLKFGLTNIKIDSSSELTDNFRIITIKSRPLNLSFRGQPYKLAGGLKFYNATFTMKADNDALPEMNDKSTVLFLTQGWLMSPKHYLNLFTSLSFREDKSASTYYFVPGYRFRFGEKWSFSLEYYMTNTERLPMKVLQFAFDEDALDFYNMNRDMYSYMFYGFEYQGAHIRVDLHLANHISFQSLIVPLLGFGWNF